MKEHVPVQKIVLTQSYDARVLPAASYLDTGRRIKDSGRPVDIIYQKLLEIEKEIVREVARGDKPYLRKSTDRKAQISPLN